MDKGELSNIFSFSLKTCLYFEQVKECQTDKKLRDWGPAGDQLGGCAVVPVTEISRIWIRTGLVRMEKKWWLSSDWSAGWLSKVASFQGF